jgi:hypothetical protein
MNNSLQNRTVVRINWSAGNSCSVAEAARVVSARVLTGIYSDDMPAEVEGLATDDTAMLAALVHAGSISHLKFTAAVEAGSASFPMVGAGLANMRNEL